MVVGLQLHVQAVLSKVVSSNLVHGKVYSIQHYVIKFVSDLQQVSGFPSNILCIPVDHKYKMAVIEYGGKCMKNPVL
jgi:hypothetical protein